MAFATIGDFPDELLEHVFAYASSCISSEEDQISLTQQTRRSILSVCRKWNSVGERYLYEEIRIESEVKLHQLLSRVTELAHARPYLVSAIQALSVSYPNPATVYTVDRAGTHFCVLLSHLALRWLVTNFNSKTPWLQMLAFKSASSLTHLDFRFPWTMDLSSAIPHLNALVNLVYLSIYDLTTKYELEEGAQAVATDPELSLPRLQELHLRTTPDETTLAPDNNQIMLLARLADLPSLQTLHICADWIATHVYEVVEHLGARLQHLVAETSEIGIIEDLHILCPRLLEFTFRASLGSAAVQEDYDFDFAHPTLQRLVVPSFDVNPLLRRMVPSAFPALEQVRLEGIRWNDLHSFQSRRITREELTHDDIRTAVELATKGISLLDEDGNVLGGVTPVKI